VRRDPQHARAALDQEPLQRPGDMPAGRCVAPGNTPRKPHASRLPLRRFNQSWTTSAAQRCPCEEADHRHPAGVGEHDLTRAVAGLKNLGYEHHGKGAGPDREYVTLRPCGGPAVNVHFFRSQSSLLADNRMIRDYLRTHPDAARDYARTKQRAVDQGRVDLLTYSHAKSEHVAAIREAAYMWARGRS
jgi:GrpB protein